jgi:two-component system chemotaxis response regulator CheB
MDEPERDVIAVGASAGGVEALRTLVRDLPPDLPAAVLVVLHRPSTGTSRLPAILDRAGPLPARHAVSGEKLIRVRSGSRRPISTWSSNQTT